MASHLGIILSFLKNKQTKKNLIFWGEAGGKHKSCAQVWTTNSTVNVECCVLIGLEESLHWSWGYEFLQDKLFIQIKLEISWWIGVH